MILFISGVLVMGYATAALYFASFWRRSRDRLFALFSWAFVILALQRVALAFATPVVAPEWLYGLRLVAFLLILGAVVTKNLGGGTRLR